MVVSFLSKNAQILVSVTANHYLCIIMKQLKYYILAIVTLVVLLKVCGNQVGTSQDIKQDIQKETGTVTATSDQPTTHQDKLEIPAPLTNQEEIILERAGYTVSYNPTTKLPNWVAWHLTADHVDGSYGRKGIKFREDEDVPTPRATDADYRGSGYDRGHMCPSGDNKWSEEAQWQSFLFTNACPQNHNLNRGDWNEMEVQCRKWAKEMGELYIVCGPILFKGEHETIGDNKVVVPEAFFKIVLCMKDTPKAIGFIYRNDEGNRPKGDYVNTVDEVERVTNIDFFPSLPDEVEKAVEATANLADWH